MISRGSFVKPKQIQLIRVGADRGCASRLSRLFANGAYHFIPIPKHNDPEFYHFSYGEPTPGKAKSLSKLRRGDVLAFYAGFKPVAGQGKPIVGIFCYFVVKELYLFEERGKKQVALEFSTNDPSDFDAWEYFKQDASPKIYKNLQKKYQRWNPHIDDGGAGRDLRRLGTSILVCGDPKQSKFLKKVLPMAKLKNGHYRLTRNQAKNWGLKVGKKGGHELNRSAVRKIDSSRVGWVWTELNGMKAKD